jgi:hypothetical protein
MKRHLLSVLILLALPELVFAQTETVTKKAGTNELTGNLVLPAGKSLQLNGTVSGTALGTSIQPRNVNLDDLADGSLTGSRVGTGINADNITAGLLSVGRGGTGQTSREATLDWLLGTYPVFLIPMTEGAVQFVDVELKASTDNFATLALWIESLGPEYAAWWNNSAADRDARICYTSDHASDVRAWKLRLNTYSLAAQIGAGVQMKFIVVIPSRSTLAGSCDAWMRPSNARNIQWSFSRRTASEAERDTLGNPIWHPIVPSYWTTGFMTSPVN